MTTSITKSRSRLDVELRTPPVTALGVVLKSKKQILGCKVAANFLSLTHLDLGVRLQAEPLGDGPMCTAQSDCITRLCSRRYAPVLARSLGKDALRPETLLGRL